MKSLWFPPASLVATCWAAALLQGCVESPHAQVQVGTSQALLAAPLPPESGARSAEVALADTTAESVVRVRGVVRYDGPAPERHVIDVSRDEHCRKLHANQPLLDQDMLVGESGELQNSFVYVRHRFTEKFPVPQEPAVLDQKNCMYSPRVQGMMAGQTLQIVNSDDLTHNVRSFPTRNRPFNLGQIGVGTREKVFDKPEREVVEFRCDIHRWMLAFVFVLDHPFFGVTGADGAFEIANLPPGEYQLVAWHEELGEQKQNIQVTADGVVEANFTFAPKQ
jgi:hypothetical protein